jgi:hypothetical protein
MIRQPQSRRGVVILVVLSLLVLFVLLVVTFAIVAGQYQRAAQAYAKKEWLGEDPQKIADRVMYALLREPDPNQTGSSLQGHSLLRDTYGDIRDVSGNWLRGAVSLGPTSLAGGQILEFSETSTTAKYRDLAGFYNGSVLTFTSGVLQNTSTRVVGFRVSQVANPPGPPNYVYTFRIMLPTVSGSSPLAPSVRDTFVLNGKPFVGTGFGFDSSAAVTAPRLSEEALLPNRANVGLTNYITGGANESYDAPDYQNLILAAVTGAGIMPSFHRPDLVRHWMDRTSSNATRVWGTHDNPTDIPADWTSSSAPNFRQFRRQVIFRPMPWDHPNFTGSNAAFDASIHSADEIAGLDSATGLPTGALFNGPWDVDNDGDGIRDSIWIDPDLPVQTTEDGRSYKPLVGILCVDLDGRLNVNAHGHYGHLAGVMSGYPAPQTVNLPGSTTSQTLPKGPGYGPPEIDLNKLINNNTEYQVLLQSRYGADQQPGQTGYDALMPFKFYEYPTNYFSTALLTSFNSNMDLRGLFACGVDYRGQPLYEGIYDTSTSPWTFPDLLAESPYEFNLNKPSADDSPFKIAELEKVLRYLDYDSASLQSRLTDLSNLGFLRNNAGYRRTVTTDSWDMPVPGVVAPDAYGMSTPPQTVMELLAERLSGFSGAALDNEIAKMLSPDLMMGLRMDVNRPIGNGRDDNGNAVVDEAYGVGNLANLNESLGPEYAKNGATNIMAIDHDNDGTISSDADAHLARSYLARHLYVLLMLLKDPTFYVDLDGDASNNEEETAQVLAQWAINAVDFRDADSIMTPFEYDYRPFNGWGVDGNILTDETSDGVDNDGDGTTDSGSELDRRVVWGCERPEVLISEALAGHDRRTEDLDSDASGKTTTDPNPPPDPHFDQRLLPRGFLFVELYNPWSGHDKPPGEFYHNGTAWTSGVLLNRVNTAGEPIWRLAITDQVDSDEPTGAEIERAVYFNNPAALLNVQDSGRQMHYTSVAAQVAPLLPGRYAVVGTAGVLANGQYSTTIGRRNDAVEGGSLGLPATRQIVLAPNPNPNVNQVEVRNNLNPPLNGTDAPTVDPPLNSFTPGPAQIQPAIAIPIDLVRTTAGGASKGKGKGVGKGGAGTDDIPLSISEPAEVDGWYPEVGPGGEIWDPNAADGEGAYSPPIDEPLDSGSLPQTNGTVKNYRRIHLQRLANPLAPYHAVVNPYRTIDVMPVDLTIFNGVESSATDPSLAVNPNEFGCFERGANSNPADRYLWPQELATAALAAPPADATHRFGFTLRHTLGYLNASYGTAFNAGTVAAIPPDPFAVTSYLGAPDTTSGAPTFPWLTWNNRPYVSPTELLLVPRSSSAHLLRDFTLADSTTSPYDPMGLGRFHHLLNFFAAHPDLNDATNLYRVFEYLTVRPRFAGTETLLNPSTNAPHFGSTAAGTEMLHPPFNGISTYREPGRINLNTLYDQAVWNALWGSHPAPMTFAEFIDSRRGYGAAGSGLFFLDSNAPTVFANPYRASGTSLLIPPDSSGGTGLGRLEVDSTLLRTNRTSMGVTAPVAGDVPRMLNSLTDLSRNSDRNAFFSYQAMQRLSNLVTCRSNVYAIWITIGYFEYDPTNGQLGQEVGIDTGTVTRNRAFYIIDRTIPVAFDPGQNHNVDKCVLLRRFIE